MLSSSLFEAYRRIHLKLPKDVPVASPIPNSSPAASLVKAQHTGRASFSNPVASLANKNMSSVSLVLAEQPVARSGHSCLPEGAPLKKIKSRPDHASIFSHKSSTSSLWGKGKGKDKSKAKDEDKGKDGDENEEDANKKHKWVSKMGNKTTEYMRQLLRIEDNGKQRGMKWEDFLKVMREMGFKYDPSAAGSAVTFYPPDKKNKPITFHKGHPDPTLYSKQIQEYGKKLKKRYGWDEEEFLRRRVAAES